MAGVTWKALLAVELSRQLLIETLWAKKTAFKGDTTDRSSITYGARLRFVLISIASALAGIPHVVVVWTEVASADWRADT